jgi:hypothetical protein
MGANDIGRRVMTASDDLFFFGVNASNRKLVYKPLPLDEVAELSKHKDDGAKDNLPEQEERQQTLKNSKDALGLPKSVKDPDDLAQAGWAIAYTEGVSEEIKGKLEPLIAFRKSQMGGNAKEMFKELTIQKNETLQDLRVRWKFGPGVIDPKKLPAYVMIVGAPTEASYDLQHKLDVDLFVGRLDLESPDAYEAYVKKLIENEKKAARPKKAVFWGPQHPDDGATALSLPNFVTPLAKYVAERKLVEVIEALGGKATKAALEGAMGAKGAVVPGLLFTGGHGALVEEFKTEADAKNQRELQGALITQEWPNDPNAFGPLLESERFAASDVKVALDGLVAIFFACFGAGTPKRSRYPHVAMAGVREMAPEEFTSRLPQRMLAKGAAAVIAHVERTWDTGFSWKDIGEPQLDTWKSVLDTVLEGNRVGRAVAYLNERFSSIAAELSAALIAEQNQAEVIEKRRRAYLFTQNEDARSWVVLGDPAARLSMA